MNCRTFAPLAVVAVSLLGVACSDDADDEAVVRSATDDGSTTTVAESPTSTTEATGTDDGSSDSGDDDTAVGSTPQDQDLNFEVRNPNGVTFKVSRLSFDDDAMYVDAEVINASNEPVNFPTYSSTQLRLVDDANQEYPYVPTDDTSEDATAIDLEPGETVNGTLAFRGPLAGRPDRLYLVTNLDTEDIPSYDINDQGAATYAPGFVVPFDLEWG